MSASATLPAWMSAHFVKPPPSAPSSTGAASGTASSAPATNGAAAGAASRTQSAAAVKGAITVIAAALRYNEMSPAQGYEAFDVDQDGTVSLDDLSVAADKLDLRLEPAQLAALLAFLDVRGVGFADTEAWCAVMADADYDDMLRDRGVDVDA